MSNMVQRDASASKKCKQEEEEEEEEHLDNSSPCVRAKSAPLTRQTKLSRNEDFSLDHITLSCANLPTSKLNPKVANYITV